MWNLFMLNDSFFSGFNYNFLNVISLLSIFCSITVIISKNPIVSVLFLIGLFFNIAGYLMTLGVNFVGLSYLLFFLGGLILLAVPLFISKILMPKISAQYMYTRRTRDNSWTSNLQYKTLSGGTVAIFDNYSVYSIVLKYFFPQTTIVWLPISGVLRGCIILPTQNFTSNRRLVPYTSPFYPSNVYFPSYALDVS